MQTICHDLLSQHVLHFTVCTVCVCVCVKRKEQNTTTCCHPFHKPLKVSGFSLINSSLISKCQYTQCITSLAKKVKAEIVAKVAWTDITQECSLTSVLRSLFDFFFNQKFWMIHFCTLTDHYRLVIQSHTTGSLSLEAKDFCAAVKQTFCWNRNATPLWLLTQSATFWRHNHLRFGRLVTVAIQGFSFTFDIIKRHVPMSDTKRQMLILFFT